MAMMKFTVKHTCGHVVTHIHSGPEEDLKRRKATLAERPCQTCSREARTSKSAAQRKAWNLPALEGTPEDLEWAEVIRMKAVADNRDYHQRLVGSAKLDKEEAALRELIVSSANAALSDLQEQRSASWWIEHRFDALQYVRRRVADAITPHMTSRQ